MNVREKLRSAQQAAEAGRYAEALEGYIWYHDNALSHDPAQAGVRLSYAIGYWLKLAQDYPPALLALKDIRDQKTKRPKS